MLNSPTMVTVVGTQSAPRTPSVGFNESDGRGLDIGLVNNMGDAALEATERQFRALLGAAAGDADVRLTFYALPEVPRSEIGRAYVTRSYVPLNELWNRRLDGLIVTGAEPRTPNLESEPYWGSLTQLLEWAERETLSSIWSCLAAHAAVLYLDGIRRQRFGVKRLGVFDSERVSDHSMMAAVPRRLRMPHSRWNDISDDALRSSGYQPLTESEEAGVDSFVKERRSLVVCFQGHPEYGAETLLLEYRRDIRRYLRGESDMYPTLPHGYFTPDAVRDLEALQTQAQSDRREDVLKHFPVSASTVTNTWRPAATAIYRGWIHYLRTRKAQKASAI